MERKNEAIRLVSTYVKGDTPTAEAIIERLQDEGLLHLGHGKAEVDQIVGTFKELFGSTRTSQMDRAAANRLATAHTTQAVIGVMKLMKQAQHQQYAPTIGSVKQLEDKWVNVISFIRRQQMQNEVVET